MTHPKSQPARRARRWMIALAIVAAMALFVVFAVPALIDVNSYRARIQSELEGRLGRQVLLGEMRLSIVPLAFRVENAAIAEDAGFRTGRPFATAQQLKVSAQLWPLLHGEVRINSLTLVRPDVELVRNREGVWNFASLGKAPAGVQAVPGTAAPAAPVTPHAAQPAATPQRPFTLAELTINDGLVAITDEQKRQPRTVYDHIDLTVEDFSRERAFPLTLAAHLPGAGKQLVKLAGTVGPLNLNEPAATPFEGTLEMDEASLAGAQKFLNSPALTGTDAVVTGSAKVKNRDGEMASAGTLELKEARIRNVALGYPVSLDYAVADNLATGLLEIGKANLKLGATPIAVSGTINTQSTPAQLDLQVKAGDIGIEEVARLAAAFGVAFNPGANVTGRVSADLRATGPASGPALRGTINASNLAISGKQLPQPVKVPQVQLTLTPQQIQSNDFTAAAGATTVAARFTLSQYTSSSPAIGASVRTVNARLNEVLDIARAYGITAVEGVQGGGGISLDAQVSGPLKDVNAMIFSGSGSLRNASLQVPGIGKPLAVRTADARFTRNGVTLSNFSGTLASTSATGQLTLSNFRAPVVQFSLDADKLIVSEWQQMLAAQPSPAPSASGPTGLGPVVYAAAPAPPPQPSFFSRMTGGGTLTAASVIYNDLTLSNAQAKVTLDRGVVRLSPITAQVYGGTESGTIVMDTRPTPAVYTVDMRLEKVDANRLLSSVSSLKQVLFGLLAGNARGSFTSTPSGEMARTLNGNVNLDVANGRLANVDLLHQLASIGRFVGYNKPMQPYTELSKLTGTFDIVNGVATTNNLQAVLGVGSVAGEGTVDLANDTLNMRLTTVLSKAFSGQIGGAGIGGMLTTALANSNGEVVIPVIVSGTFQKPRVMPDAQKLAEMRLRNLLPTAGNPAGMTSGILGAILDRQGGQQGGLGGVLGTILGPPRKQEPGQQQPQQQPATPGQAQPAQQQQKQQPGQVLGDILKQVLGGTQKPQLQPPQQPPGQQQPPPKQPTPSQQQPPPQPR